MAIDLGCLVSLMVNAWKTSLIQMSSLGRLPKRSLQLRPTAKQTCEILTEGEDVGQKDLRLLPRYQAIGLQEP
jgi:hypothetical protein